MPRVTEETQRIDAKFGAAIQALRVQRGLSRDQLGKMLCITHQQVGKYENAQNRPSAGRIYSICNALGVDFIEFMSSVATTNDRQKYSRMTIEVARNFANIKCPKAQKKAADLVRIIAEE